MREPRVLITVPRSLRGGGVASYFEALAPHMSERWCYFLVGASSAEERRLGRLLRVGCDALRLAATVVESRADVIHVNPSLDAWSLLRDGLSVLVAKTLRRKVVVFFHGWEEMTARRLQGVWLVAFSLVFFRADACIVLSSGFRDALRAWGYLGPIHVVTTVVSEDLLARCSEGVAAKRHSRAGGANVLFLARAMREKGILTTIAAFVSASTRVDGLTLRIAGDGPDLDVAIRMAQKCGIPRAVFAGDIRGQEKADALTRADIYVLPTTHGEGMPTSVLEAMAFGALAITCPVAGLRDFFGHGELGLVAPEATEEAFADLITVAASDRDLRRAIGERAHAFAVKHFAPSVSAERLRQIYQGAVMSHGAAKQGLVWYEAEHLGPGAPHHFVDGSQAELATGPEHD